MAKKKMAMPISNYRNIEKIARAHYSPHNKGFTIEEIAKNSGNTPDLVKRNVNFLTRANITTTGPERQLTEIGRKLVLSIDHSNEDGIRENWRNIITSMPEMEPVFQRLRIEGSYSKEKLTKIMFEVLELIKNNRTNAGVGCLIKILEKSRIIKSDNGKFTIDVGTLLTEAEPETELEANEDNKTKQETPESVKESKVTYASGYPNLHIDIQIHISADAKPEQIEQIFASMAKHLNINKLS